jgi:hypothetical protein
MKYLGKGVYRLETPLRYELGLAVTDKKKKRIPAEVRTYARSRLGSWPVAADIDETLRSSHEI